MAITITKQPQGELLDAYNNMIFEFTSTNYPLNNFGEVSWPLFYTANFGILNQINVIKAIVRVDNINIELTPIAGKFYVDMKPIITMDNKNNFSDPIEIPPSQPFVIKDASLYFQKTIHFKVFLKNGIEEHSITRSFLKSVKQTIRPKHQESDILRVLLPSIDNNLKQTAYYEGYPFDVSIFSNSTRTVTIKHLKTQISATVELKKGVNRLFLSNGENDNLGFESVIPMFTGVNPLEIKIDNNTKTTLFVDRKPIKCGVYIKWFNRSGGWSYWLCKPVHIENEQNKELEKLNNDFYNIHENKNGTIATGKESEREWILNTGQMTNDERIIVAEIFTSPKVYLYNNTNLQPFELSDFIEVKIKPGTNELKNTKFKKKEYIIRIEQPKQYLQTYAN